MSNKLRATISIMAITAVLSSSATVALASETGGDQIDPVAAIEAITPEVLAVASSVASDEVDVVLPSDAGDGVVLDLDGFGLHIGLPNDSDSSTPIPVTDAVVTIDNNDGSSSVPLVRGEGELQVLTVIENSSAPERYAYEIDLPVGGELFPLDDGRAAIADHEGIVVGVFQAPWATDAAGSPVATHYEVSGNSLIQVVQHAGAQYPVVADPWWITALKMMAKWTKHGLQQQATRNISDAAVKRALQEGKIANGNSPGTKTFTYGGVRVIVNKDTGAIITVYRPGGGTGAM